MFWPIEFRTLISQISLALRQTRFIICSSIQILAVTESYSFLRQSEQCPFKRTLVYICIYSWNRHRRKTDEETSGNNFTLFFVTLSIVYGFISSVHVDVCCIPTHLIFYKVLDYQKRTKNLLKTIFQLEYKTLYDHLKR